MAHASKKLGSTVARLSSVSTSHIKFPPSEALFQRGSIPKVFSPETWAAQQPSPPSALSAFAHRIGLGTVLEDTETIEQACTHPSFAPFFKHFNPEVSSPATNAQWSYTGNALMGLFAAEHINAKYPYLPTRVLKAAVTSYVGPVTCANVAQEMGATPLLRWHRVSNTPLKRGILHNDALASIPRALTALVYQKRSLPAARKFVDAYFLNREVDLRPLIKFAEPKKALLEMVKKFGRELPKSRLLKETGRFSNSPVFVVGIFSGSDQLGEGFGSSLKMAEYRAAEDALLRVMLTQRRSDELQLPSSTFGTGVGNVFELGDAVDVDYQAPELVMPELMQESSGNASKRMSSVVPSRGV